MVGEAMMQRMMCWVLGPLLVVGAGTGNTFSKAGETSAGMEILRKSEAALAKVERVSYSATFKSTGFVTAFLPSLEGKVIVGQRSKWDLDRFRCEAKIKSSQSSETLHFTVGSDGNMYFLIDPKTKKAHEDMDPLVMGSHGRDIQRLVMDAFSADHPFGEELKPDAVELKGSETIGGVECHQVLIKGKGGFRDPNRIWFIAKQDLLPRGIRRLYNNRRNPEGKPGTTELMLTGLKVNPKFTQDPFTLVVPKGFSKTDKFAP